MKFSSGPRLRTLLLLACIASVSAISIARATAILPPSARSAPRHLDAPAADAALATLERAWYVTPGHWNGCVPAGCEQVVRDWGADSLTYTLFLRWKIARDASIPPLMTELAASAPLYEPCRLPACTAWSDVPMWDSIAASREFEVTANATALLKARRAFASVDASDAFALGACPQIDFQRPRGGKSHLKTLETDSNYIKAALLLARSTGDAEYVRAAIAKYAAVRRYFLDPKLPLYTVYLFDTGDVCTPVPGRFYASVNGNMISNGLALAAQTGNRAYLADALATAHAVADTLHDSAGFYAGAQADNDVAEPLVEAMYDLAAEHAAGFAREWLVANAGAAVPARNGSYGRFFAGPPPTGSVSIWSVNGGFALAIAAGAFERPTQSRIAPVWATAHFVAAPIVAAPATIAFNGRAVALLGAIGDVCCEPGHVRVFVDGRETVDTTGIWQNKSPAARRLPNSVLFSWRWPHAGRHTIAFRPGELNAKEGGSYINLQGYELVP